MKNFFKKKGASNNSAEPAVSKKANKPKKTAGLGKSSQGFLSKFKKNNKKSAPQATPAAASPDPYTPPSAAAHAASGSYNATSHSWYALNGRIGRVQFIAFGVIWGLIITAVYIVAALLVMLIASSIFDLMLGLVTVLVLPALVYAYVLIPRRRLHDIGKSAWWLLLAFVPLANLLLLYYLYLAPGDAGANRFGQPPAPYNKTQLYLAYLLPVMFILGIVAGIALPSMLPQQPVVIEESTTPLDEPVTLTPEDAPIIEEGANAGIDEAVVSDGDGNVVDEAVVTDSEPLAGDAQEALVEGAPEATQEDVTVTQTDEPIDETQAQIDAAINSAAPLTDEEIQQLAKPLYRESGRTSGTN